MFKKALLAATFTALSFSASADWVSSAGYSNFSDEVGSQDLSLGTLNLGLGYQFKTSDKGSFTPELRYGFGITDDKLYGVTLEIKRFIALSIRGQYDFDSNWYMYAQPTYANLEIEAKAGNSSASDDSWEFGGGLGLGYEFSGNKSIEVGYEHFDGTDVISASLRFGF